MPKLTRYQRQTLNDLVVNATVRRLNVAETQQLIKSNLQVDIGPDYLYHLRGELKHDSAKELQSLQKDRDYYLQRLFWDRLAELEYQQQVLHRVIDNNKDNPDVQIKAVHELRAITTDMAQLFINLPAASTMSIPIPFNSNVTQRLERQKESIFLHDEHDVMRLQQQGQEYDPSDQP